MDNSYKGLVIGLWSFVSFAVPTLVWSQVGSKNDTVSNAIFIGSFMVVVGGWIVIAIKSFSERK